MVIVNERPTLQPGALKTKDGLVVDMPTALALMIRHGQNTGLR